VLLFCLFRGASAQAQPLLASFSVWVRSPLDLIFPDFVLALVLRLPLESSVLHSKPSFFLHELGAAI
jgi:hypothetical protein